MPGTILGLAIIVAAVIIVGGGGVLFYYKDRVPPLPKGWKRRFLQNQIAKKTRRLYKLKEQEASQGNKTDPAVLTEIEDLENEIEQLMKELEALG